MSAAERELGRYRRLYSVRDVYLTQSTSHPARFAELRTLAGDARAHGAKLVVLDPSAGPVRRDFTIANIVVTFSGPVGRLRTASRPSWLAHVSSTRQAVILTGADPAQARRALALARRRGAGVAYATSGTGSRALSRPPTYLGHELAWLTGGARSG